jgi:lipopolysaccharide export system permease protein
MKVLQRYFGAEIIRSVAFVLLVLLVLTSFFELMNEIPSVNKNTYQISEALLVVVLGIPGNAYDFMPIAVLIGTIYVLAQFASNSEFTIMRAASMSPVAAAVILIKIAVIFVACTFLVGEIVAPMSSKMAKKVKLSATGSITKQELRSGLWAKDMIRDTGVESGNRGKIIGTRFINVKDVLANKSLSKVKIYEFDIDFQLVRELSAGKAEYIRSHVWELSDVVETNFPKNLITADILAANTQKLLTKELTSEVTPEILSVLFVDPERMSAFQLAKYAQHLTENKQATNIYDIAFWKKVTYPLTILVMMALALPFAYLHARDGGISLRIFSGIMLGMVFYLVNSLFSHLGLINTWPAYMTALFPSLLFFAVALGFLRYVQRN